MRAALYSRVSTVDQDPEMQAHELRQYCAARGWQIAAEFRDQISGTKESRPGLDALLVAARRREFDVLIVWKLDRLARSLRHLLNLLTELEALGIQFVSLRDALDLTTPGGRLQFQIIGAMAEFERP